MDRDGRSPAAGRIIAFRFAEAAPPTRRKDPDSTKFCPTQRVLPKNPPDIKKMANNHHAKQAMEGQLYRQAMAE
jgi:hypothetical protein